jgi:hypothetical protein
VFNLVIQRLDPARGSIDGNTVVNVTSTFGDGSGNLLSDIDLRCVWDDATVTPVLNVQFQSLQCISPATAASGQKNLRIRWKNTWWTTNSAPFSYYGKREIFTQSQPHTLLFRDFFDT